MGLGSPFFSPQPKLIGKRREQTKGDQEVRHRTRALPSAPPNPASPPKVKVSLRRQYDDLSRAQLSRDPQ